MVGDLVTTSEEGGDIAMTPDIAEAMTVTRDFLFERVYLGRISPATTEAVQEIVRTLLDHYASNPVPEDEGRWAEDHRQGAVDYVAGMTDRFALRAYGRFAGEPPPELAF